MQDIHDLGLMLDRHVPLILIESRDEPRVLDLLTRLAIRRALAVQQWTLTDGLRRLGFGEDPALANSDQPEQALRHIKSSDDGGLYVFCDLHPFLDQPVIVRLLKDIALQHERRFKTVVLVSHQLKLPPELQRLAMRFSLQLPDEQQLMSLIQEEARRYSASSGRRVKTDPRILQQLVANLRGLTWADARRLIRGAIVDDGAITQADVPEVAKAKMQLLDMDGVLSFEFDTARLADVAGLGNLKQWLQQREKAFLSAATDLRPKGLMLFGVQGSGKSLAARAVAGSWGVPLLRLDMGALYNKFFGETERNLREALKLAELMSPCVIWMDEVEKGLAGGEADGGMGQRLLGTLLTWMADHQSRVFVVATANNIEVLPPEFMRKGRLDEIFFVDLPGLEVRRAILELHLRKRGFEAEQIDLDALGAVTEGFSGAELEQVVVSAWYSSLDDDQNVGQALQTTRLLDVIRATRPLSVTRAESLQSLRLWARDRAVNADGPFQEKLDGRSGR